MGFWGLLGKGIKWVIRHPEAVEGAAKMIGGARGKKREADPEPNAREDGRAKCLAPHPTLDLFCQRGHGHTPSHIALDDTGHYVVWDDIPAVAVPRDEQPPL